MQKILIIGATSDVAIAIAHAYAKEGAHLLLAARNQEAVENLSKDISIRYDVDCSPIVLDILAIDTHKSIIENLKEIPDTTICVAGYLGEQEVASKNWEETAKIIHTNFTGVVSLINLIAARYEENKNGTITVFSSVAGERGRQSNYTYGSAKAALTAYLSGLRNRLYPSGVHVLTVKPGFIATKMTEEMDLPKPLTATPDKVATATLKAIKKKKNTLYVLWTWKYIMLIIRNIPEGIFKKLKL